MDMSVDKKLWMVFLTQFQNRLKSGVRKTFDDAKALGRGVGN